MHEKPLIWVGSSLKDVKAFPLDARRSVGFQLWRVQAGLEPNDYKPMPSIGPGVRELRIHSGLEHRVLYLARFAEGVYILHAFEKRSRKTSRRDLDVAKSRLRALLEERTRPIR